jgi:hypothetical protein
LPSYRPKIFKNDSLDVLGENYFELLNYKQLPALDFHNTDFKILREKVFQNKLLDLDSSKFDILNYKKKAFEQDQLDIDSDVISLINFKEKVPLDISNCDFEVVNNSNKVFPNHVLDFNNHAFDLINKMDRHSLLDINSNTFNLINRIDRNSLLNIDSNRFDLINRIDRNSMLNIDSNKFDLINRIDRNSLLDIDSNTFDLINRIDRNSLLNIDSNKFDLINKIDRNSLLDINSNKFDLMTSPIKIFSIDSLNINKHNFGLINGSPKAFKNDYLNINKEEFDIINHKKKIVLDLSRNDEFEIKSGPKNEAKQTPVMDISSFEVNLIKPEKKEEAGKKKITKIIKKIIKKPTQSVKDNESVISDLQSERETIKSNFEITSDQIELIASKPTEPVQTKKKIVKIIKQIKKVQTAKPGEIKSSLDDQTQPVSARVNPLTQSIESMLSKPTENPLTESVEIDLTKENPLSKSIIEDIRKFDVSNEFSVTFQGAEKSPPYSFRDMKRRITFSDDINSEEKTQEEEKEKEKAITNYLEQKFSNPFDDNENNPDPTFTKLREKIVSDYLEKQKKKIKEQLKDKIKPPIETKSSPSHSRKGSSNSIEHVDRSSKKFGTHSPLSRLNHAEYEQAHSEFEIITKKESVTDHQVEFTPNFKQTTPEPKLSEVNSIKKELTKELTNNHINSPILKKKTKVNFVVEKEESEEEVEEEDDEEEPVKKINIVSVKSDRNLSNSRYSNAPSNNNHLVKLNIVIEKVDVGFRNFFLKRYFRKWKPLKVPSFVNTFKSNKQLLNKSQSFKRSFNNLNDKSNNSISNSYSINIKYEVILNRLVDLYKNKTLDNIRRCFTKFIIANETSHDNLKKVNIYLI